MYRGKEDKGKEFTYYDSSEEIRKLLINHFRSPLVSFNPLNVNVSREFVPHLTLSNTQLSFDFEDSEDNGDIGSTSKGNEIISALLKNFVASEEKENVNQICNSILEELMLDVVSRGERCSLCFVTHFPWLKVCRKNNKKKANMSITGGKDSTMNLQPKLRGGARAPKFLITDSQNTQNLLTILRSLDVLSKHNGHDKCEIATGKNVQSSLCDFCLIRSLIIRSNLLKGRAKIKPVEFLGYDEEHINSLSLKELLKFYFNELFNSAPFLEENFLTTWDCTVCFSSNALSLYIDFSDPIAQGKDVNYLFSFWDKTVGKEHSEHFNFDEENKKASVLFVVCDLGVSVNLSSHLSFLGRQWSCKSVISSSLNVFSHNKQFYKVGNETIEAFNETLVTGATLVAYEIFNEKESNLDENFSYAGADVNRLALSTFDKRKGDRHLDPKGDRHLDPKADRHINKKFRGSKTFEKLCEEIKTETGMDTICCICLELKSSNSCTNVEKLSRNKIDKYVVELELTKNKDGKYQVCWTCLQAINKDKEPTRAQREYLGFLDFPESFKIQGVQFLATFSRSI